MKFIISSTSPLSGFQAQVFTENDCSYLYVFTSESADQLFAVCWIKNHVKVSSLHSLEKDMKKGLQPKMPAKYCNFKDDLGLLKADQLEIVWGKEGITVGLYENGELICIVPYWVDPDHEFVGYSKYSSAQKMIRHIPLPLGDTDQNDPESVTYKMAEARKFWQQDFEPIWRHYVESYLSELESQYGKHIKYYGIDGGEFPPKALVVFEQDNIRYAFTIGIGLFPQPKVALYIEDYRDHEFFELGFCYRSDAHFDETKVFTKISTIAKMPWYLNTFLDHNHTIEFEINERYQNVVLITDRRVNIAQSEFIKENNINLLWLVPIDDEAFEKINDERSTYGYVKSEWARADILYKG